MFSFLFGRRDEKIYPHDEFGDELYRAFPKPDAIPSEAVIWFDVYFDEEADADAMFAYFQNLGAEITRDFDDEDDEFGRWNVDAEFAIKPNYREVKCTVERMKDRIQSYRGKLGSFVISENDDE